MINCCMIILNIIIDSAIKLVRVQGPPQPPPGQLLHGLHDEGLQKEKNEKTNIYIYIYVYIYIYIWQIPR